MIPESFRDENFSDKEEFGRKGLFGVDSMNGTEISNSGVLYSVNILLL
jgi:hypothetical protein